VSAWRWTWSARRTMLDSAMTDDEQIEIYRRMTPAQRWEVWRDLCEVTMSLWEANLDEAEMERRWEIWRREHDLSDRNMLRAFRDCA